MSAKDPNENRPGYKETKVGWIPDDWSVSHLGGVATFLDSKRVPLKEADREKRHGPYPYYGASGVIDHVDDYLFDEELILLGEDGANITARSSPLAFKVSGKVWVNNHAHVIRPNKSSSLGYLCEYLESIRYEKYNTGSAQPKLNREVCETIPVPDPRLPEQEKIADILSTCDEAIEKTGDLIKAKQRQKKALMQQLLTGKKRLPGFEGEWQEAALSTLLKESRETGNLGGVAKKLTVKLYGRGVVEKRETQAGSDATQYYRRRAGQFIYSKLDFLNGAFGIVPPELDGFESTLDLPAFDVSDSVIVDWLLYYVLQENFYKRWFPLANGGRKARRINPADFKHITVRVPPLGEQQAITDLLHDCEAQLGTLEAKLSALKKQKKALMQKLLTGQVRVKV